MYKITWEMVGAFDLWRFCNADPAMYEGTQQTVPNSEIPDEYWRPVDRETDDPDAQFGQLKEWADADEQFVRNVRLYEMVSSPRWKQVR